jgi:hypothetical protein
MGTQKWRFVGSLAADLRRTIRRGAGLRGIGLLKPADGYEKKTRPRIRRCDWLGYDKTFVVAHDIGNMVAYAYAAVPDKVERLVVMDAPIWVDPWNEIL